MKKVLLVAGVKTLVYGLILIAQMQVKQKIGVVVMGILNLILKSGAARELFQKTKKI